MIAKKLKDLRNDKKISQDQLASILGTSKTSISNYENGLRVPDADFIIKAAKYFSVSADFLLGITADANFTSLNPEYERISRYVSEAMDSSGNPFKLEDFIQKMKSVIDLVNHRYPETEIFLFKSLEAVLSVFSSMAMWTNMQSENLKEVLSEFIEKEISKNISIGIGLSFTEMSTDEYKVFINNIEDNIIKAREVFELEIYKTFIKIYREGYKEDYINLKDSDLNVKLDYRWMFQNIKEDLEKMDLPFDIIDLK